jgi:pilus assembly protein CpaB
MNRNAVASMAGGGNRKLIIAAVALGLIGALLVYMSASKKSTSTSSSSATAAGVPAVVAKADIPARTKITATMVEVRLVPEDARSTLGYTDTTQVVGQVTRFPITANEQVLSNKVVSLAGTVGGSKSLSYVIPQGKRAMSFNASTVQQAGGLILPGDYIDIVALYDVDFAGRTAGDRQTASKYLVQTVLQNVQVLAIAQSVVDLVPETTPTAGGQQARNSEAKADPGAATVTLALTPEEAERIYLAEANGQIRMSLRAYGDGTTRPIDFVTKLELVPQNLPNPFLR